jgi:hypothetical protein
VVKEYGNRGSRLEVGGQERYDEEDRESAVVLLTTRHSPAGVIA